MARNNRAPGFTFFFIILGLMMFEVVSFPTLIMAAVAYMILSPMLASRDRQRNDPRERRRDTDFDRRDRRSSRQAEQEQRNREIEQRRRQRQQTQRPTSKPSRGRNNPFKTSGLNKFKEYDYNGAIEDFEQALSIEPKSPVIHFNIACAYSLTEQKDKSFYHLSQAVQNGFNDMEKIQKHDALAYLRIQDEFEGFVKNGYKLANNTPAAGSKKSEDLLEQLNKLAELRERGLLTDEEFVLEKKKLLG